MLVLTESSYETNILSESTEDGNKNWFIEGIFLQSEVVNRNRRIYPKDIMDREVNLYKEDYVKTKRAVGELSHPDTPQINLDKVTHLIESVEADGNNYFGRAKILKTPCGQIVSALMEGGVTLGVSSRGLGTVTKMSNGISRVRDDFKMKAIDIVYQPSAPDAFVEGLMESANFVWNTINEDVEFLESLKSEVAAAKTHELQEAKIEAFNKFLNHIKTK